MYNDKINFVTLDDLKERTLAMEDLRETLSGRIGIIDMYGLTTKEIYPIEIKMSSNPGKESVKNINSLRNLNMNIKDGLVICMEDEIFPIKQNNYLVPINYI